MSQLFSLMDNRYYEGCYKGLHSYELYEECTQDFVVSREFE